CQKPSAGCRAPPRLLLQEAHNGCSWLHSRVDRLVTCRCLRVKAYGGHPLLHLTRKRELQIPGNGPRLRREDDPDPHRAVHPPECARSGSAISRKLRPQSGVEPAGGTNLARRLVVGTLPGMRAPVFREQWHFAPGPTEARLRRGEPLESAPQNLIRPLREPISTDRIG